MVRFLLLSAFCNLIIVDGKVNVVAAVLTMCNKNNGSSGMPILCGLRYATIRSAVSTVHQLSMVLCIQRTISNVEVCVIS